MAKNGDDVIEKILNATLEIVAQETIGGTRMRSIAKKAGVVQSNLHYYFNTKDELLLSLLDKILDTFQQQRSEHDSGKGADDEPLSRFFQQKKMLIKDKEQIDFVQLDFWVQAMVHPEIRPKMKNFFKVWREDIGTDISKLSEAEIKKKGILASLVISLLMGASLQYLIDEKSFDLDDYFITAQKMVEQFIEGEK